MREEKWTEQLGHRSRRPWCLVVHQGTVSRFVGADIPGVLAVVGTDYRKDGKWSSTTYRLAVADSAKLIGGHMGWETGTFREGLRKSLLASPLDRWASIASALGVSVQAVQQLIRPWLPDEAADLDRVEEQMAALERAEEAAATEARREETMIYLMNSAVMPAGNYGTYRYRPATLDDLRSVVQGEYSSAIGYAQNADLIEKWTGIRVPVQRIETTFEPGDRALVMRLRSRVANPATKGQPVSEDPADWEFAWVEYEG